MAWTTPTAYTTGLVVTAARLNVEVKDDLLFLFNAPSARAYNSANLTIATATPTVLTLNSERHDNDGIHSTSTDTGRLTCVTAGVYSIAAHVQFAVNATGGRSVKIRLNGSTPIAADERAANGTASWASTITLPTKYKLAVGDYVEIVVEQSSGGNLNVLATGNLSPEFAMTRVSAG